MAAEFALVLALLLLILFALAELGMLLTTQLVVVQAVRETARRAAIEGGATSGAWRVLADTLHEGGLDLNRSQAVIRPTHAIYGTPITVTLQYRYPLRTPLSRMLHNRAIELAATVTARSEFLISPRGP